MESYQLKSCNTQKCDKSMKNGMALEDIRNE